MMTPLSPGDAALEYYYHGFLRALRHYRAVTMAGWLVAAVGGAGFFASCRTEGDPIAAGVPLTAFLAGIALVHQSVARLEAYVAVPFPPPDATVTPEGVLPLLQTCAELMDDVDRGGWQEAYAALRTLQAMPAERLIQSIDKGES